MENKDLQNQQQQVLDFINLFLLSNEMALNFISVVHFGRTRRQFV